MSRINSPVLANLLAPMEALPEKGYPDASGRPRSGAAQTTGEWRRSVERRRSARRDRRDQRRVALRELGDGVVPDRPPQLAGEPAVKMDGLVEARVRRADRRHVDRDAGRAGQATQAQRQVLQLRI